MTLPSSAVPPTAPVAESWGLTHIEVIKFSYVWTINNFSFCAEKPGEYLESPKFSAGANDKLKWSLKVYPKGDDVVNKDYLSLFLSLVSCDHADGVRAKFKVSILNARQEELKANKSQVARFYQDDGGWGFDRFLCRYFLLNEMNGYLTDDKLKLGCEISLVADSFNMTGQKNIQSFKTPDGNLPNDMEQLFESQRFSDFILGVNGQELLVHKCILASRSSVFAAMFENEMAEKKDNRVEITDVDVDVMKEMLRFVYTGKAPCAENMAEDLFVVADKYALHRLKEICEEALCANLSIDTASNVLVLADLHNADQLKTRVIDYIILYAAEVMATSCWETKVMQRPHLVAAVLQALANKQQHYEPLRKRPKLT